MQVSLKSDNLTLHEDQYTFLIISVSVLIRMRNFADKFVEKIKTHSFSNYFFFENHGVYDKMLKNFVECGRSQKTIRLMRNSYWKPKATNTHTHTICNTYWFSKTRVVTRTHLNITLYVQNGPKLGIE